MALLDSRHILSVVIVLITAVIIRLSVCLPMFRQKRKFKGASIKTLIVFGSGIRRINSVRMCLTRRCRWSYHRADYAYTKTSIGSLYSSSFCYGTCEFLPHEVSSIIVYIV